MLSMIKRFWLWLKSLFTAKETEAEKKDEPLYLACNGAYIARIESLERLIEQTKIDYALGWITKEIYDSHFEEFRKQVRELSAAYARELLLYSA